MSYNETTDRNTSRLKKYRKQRSYNQNSTTSNHNELEVTSVMNSFQKRRDKNQSATNTNKHGIVNLVLYQIYSISIKKARCYLRDWISSFVPVLFLFASIWCGAVVSKITFQNKKTTPDFMDLRFEDYERYNPFVGVGSHGEEAEKVMGYYKKYVESKKGEVSQVNFGSHTQKILTHPHTYTKTYFYFS